MALREGAGRGEMAAFQWGHPLQAACTQILEGTLPPPPLQAAQPLQQHRNMGGDLTNVSLQSGPGQAAGVPPGLPAFSSGNATASFASLAPLSAPLGSGNGSATFASLAPLSLPLSGPPLSLTSLHRQPQSPFGLTPLGAASPGGCPMSPAFMIPSLASPGPLGSPVTKSEVPAKRTKSIGRL
eukprot:CAMPEP_0171094570 /NCGR_PEP_ID=MMETSP0766_2-20121228/41617_1 /TAXON_ID=439317 /ORGANISM="Gambierdiscus australes, Strain CAWD 149" /LENGTH=182 /DNA_ID=CAMNT_0011553239 /DNA_START=31 /DNA_END=579 /DNA_ORIENTATION=-